jgi:integrase
MRDKNFPGVSRHKGRDGRIRWRARGKGKPEVMLPGAYGSPEFIAAWQAWKNEKTEIGASRTLPGSLSALLAAYYQHLPQSGLSRTTQLQYRATLERIRAKNGDKPKEVLSRKNIIAIRDRLKPEPSNMMLRAIRHLCRYAIDREMIDADPTSGLKKVRTKSDGFHSWTDGEVEQFEAHWPIGSRERLALSLLLYTAQRRSDVVRLGRQHEVDGGAALSFRQVKTGAKLVIPIVAPLREAISAGPTGALTYLETAHGKPFTSAGFGNWFGDACRAAGLKRCTAHGLRKAAATRLANAGCTTHAIRAITGHKTLGEVQRYTNDVDQRRLAETAAGHLVGAKREQKFGKLLPRSGKLPPKPLK